MIYITEAKLILAVNRENIDLTHILGIFLTKKIAIQTYHQPLDSLISNSINYIYGWCNVE